MKSLTRQVIYGAALVLLTAGITVRQASGQTTGGLLTVTDTDHNILFSVSDAGIHSGTPRTSPCDGLVTDAYVLQGGSPNGCDNGDPFELSQSAGILNVSGPGYSFTIETHYLQKGDNEVCNSNNTICAGPDSGFLYITNMDESFPFSGTISLSGTSGSCGPASDTWTQGVGFNQTVKLALGASGDVTTHIDSSNCGGWSNASGTTALAQTAPPVPVPAGQTTDADFSFSNTAGAIVDHQLHFPSTLTFPNGDVNVLSSNTLLSNGRDWPPFVIGTPFAPSQLFVKNGDNQAANGTDFGSMYDDKCYSGSDPSTASESQCPFFNTNDTDPTHFITAKDTFDPTTKPEITPGTANNPPCVTDACTAALIHFYPAQSDTEVWSPSATSPNPVCTDALNGNPNNPPPPHCDLANARNFMLTGDQTTSSGGTRRKGAYVSVFNVPMLETQVTVNGIRVNTPGRQSNAPVSVPFQPSGSIVFDVNPAGCPFPFSTTTCVQPNGTNNNFVPAPPALLTYSATGPTPISNTSASGDTTGLHPIHTVNNTTLSPGQYVIQWQSLDSVGVTEQNIQKLINGETSCDSMPASSSHPCYLTTPFTATVKIAAAASADLALFKFASRVVKTRTNLTYTIGAVNFGPNTAYGVTITDPLPNGTSFVSAIFSTVSCTAGGCSTPIRGQACDFDNNTKIVTCRVGTVPRFTRANPNGVGVKLVVNVTAATGNRIRNTAQTQAFNTDPNPANNSFTATTCVGDKTDDCH